MRRLVTSVIVAVLAVTALSGCTGTEGHAPVGATTASHTPTTSTPSPSHAPEVSAADRATVRTTVAALEREYDAAVGVVATDTVTGETIAYGADRRFGYASTIKLFAAAEFLRTVPAADRQERVRWTASDVRAAGHSPVTSQHLADGLTTVQLAEAAVRESDNTALDLVLQRTGGPAALDAALTAMGDSTTEVVGTEPELNTIEPGSTADTTTAAAFTADLRAVLGGGVLGPRDRDTLLDWMSGNATGDTLVRAGAPAGWTVADKSGGAGGIRNDVALVTRPHGDPIAVTVLTARNDPAAAYDDALVARTAAAVLGAFA